MVRQVCRFLRAHGSPFRRVAVLSVSLLSLALVLSVPRALGEVSAAPDGGKQTVLGPGLYVFQTRTRDASCGDSEPDGYVLTFFAAIHGIPHSIGMSMELTNNAHFKNWTLKVIGNNQVVGESRMGSSAEAPDSRFDVKLDGERFKGTGYRSYNGTVDGKKVRCRVNYDALLRRLDL